MNRSTFLFLAGLVLGGATVSSAGPVNYLVTVKTTGLSGGGWLDLQFNQANALTSLSATAAISDFTYAGLGAGSLASAGVTGTLPGDVVIPNDVSAANYYTQEVSSWVGVFKFRLTLDGPGVGGLSPDGSGFFIFLLDSTFAPLAGPLASGEAGNVLVNGDGSVIPEGSAYVTFSQIPEPATWMTFAAGAVAVALLRKR